MYSFMPGLFHQHNYLRSILVAACINNSFLLLSIKQSITWIYHNLFIYSPLDDLWIELTYGLS